MRTQFTWFANQQHKQNFFLTEKNQKQEVYIADMTKNFNYYNIIKYFMYLNDKFNIQGQNIAYEQKQSKIIYDLGMIHNTHSDRTMPVINDNNFSFAIAIRQKIEPIFDKLQGDSNEEVISKYSFDKIMRKLLMIKGKQPFEFQAIQQYILVNQLYPEGIIHSIQYMHDNYRSSIIDKSRSIQICDLQLENKLIDYTKKVFLLLEAANNTKVLHVRAIYLLDQEGKIYLKCINMAEQMDNFELQHEFSIQKMGVKPCSVINKQIVKLEQKLPKIPQTARNILNAPFLGPNSTIELKKSFRQISSVIGITKIKEGDDDTNQNQHLSNVSQSIMRRNMSLLMKSQDYQLGSIVTRTIDNDNSRIQSQSTKSYIRDSPKQRFEQKYIKKNLLKLRKSFDKINEVLKDYAIDDNKKSTLQLEHNMGLDSAKNLTSNQYQTFLAQNADDYIKHKQGSFPLLNKTGLTQLINGSGDVSKSIRNLYENKKQGTYTHRDRYNRDHKDDISSLNKYYFKD
ncbi:UNKNOWN [Stylonychia lemnae]|uniref:Uncharacterized protein n=1 Tax=Stylonychia lemnae TaxID=5949 RepID=A0A078AQ98_STYLE|nr:UNKNOWN [Stylonychia lemnae]|eukprot:CDW84339.1 UNKNOWN [Stylonychia lemnae]